jgi:hypothetical protein
LIYSSTINMEAVYLPKRRWTSTALPGVTFQAIVLFTLISVRILNKKKMDDISTKYR